MENSWIVHRPTSVGQRIDKGALNPAAIGEPLQADQQRISGESGSRRIRRVAEAERPEGQHLPQTLTRRRKKIRERISRRTKVSNPATRRERRGMKQNSAGTGESHSDSVISNRF